MRLLGKLGLLGCVGFVLLLLGTTGFPVALYRQMAVMCPGGQIQHDFVAGLLPSITSFELFGISDGLNPNTIYSNLVQIHEATIPIRRSGGAVITDTIMAEVQSMRLPEFQKKLNDMPIAASPERTFRGQIPGLSNSLVALYIQQDRDISGKTQPGFVSGFLLEDKKDLTKPWYFIEPVRPLLKPLVQTNSSKPSSPYTVNDIDQCIPPRSYTHIVYEASGLSPSLSSGIDHDAGHHAESTIAQAIGQDCRQTQQTHKGFCIDLDPARSAKAAIIQFIAPRCASPNNTIRVQATVANLTVPPIKLANTKVQLFIDNEPPIDPQAPVPILNPGNQVTVSFTHIFTNTGTFILEVRTDASAMRRPIRVIAPNEKCPGPQLQLISIVAIGDEAFYDHYRNVIEEKDWSEGQEELLNLVDAFYSTQSPSLQFKVRALETWASGGPGSIIPDSGIHVYNLLCQFAQGFPSPTPHTDPGGPALVHLFSGRNWGPLPTPKAIPDSGDGFCQSSCTIVGTAIVGLAEGVGGFKTPTAMPQICAPPSNPNDGPPPATDRFEPAHHALSRHSPILGMPDKNPNVNFDVTLYQRFLLLAHEIGHNLGANHSQDNTSIMYTPLQNTIRFKLDPVINAEEISTCLAIC